MPYGSERLDLISERRSNLAEPLIKSLQISKKIIDNISKVNFRLETNCPKVNVTQLNVETHFVATPGFAVIQTNAVVVVKSVAKDEPAHRAGLKKDDLIVSCNGKPAVYEKLANDLEQADFGDEFDLVIRRDNEEKEIRFYAE